MVWLLSSHRSAMAEGKDGILAGRGVLVRIAEEGNCEEKNCAGKHRSFLTKD